ncbi:hypothetical protein GCM10009853_026800 [Glycomyces scopariae]
MALGPFAGKYIFGPDRFPKQNLSDQQELSYIEGNSHCMSNAREFPDEFPCDIGWPLAPRTVIHYGSI